MDGIVFFQKKPAISLKLGKVYADIWGGSPNIWEIFVRPTYT